MKRLIIFLLLISLHLNKASGVTIKNGFTVEEGATLTIE